MNNRRKKVFDFDAKRMTQLLQWASKHEYYSFLNGNRSSSWHGSFPNIIFVGNDSKLESDSNSFEKLDKLYSTKNDWLYGYLSYDLKNEIEDLESKNLLTIPVHHLGFYLPASVIQILGEKIVIESVHDPQEVFDQITSNNNSLVVRQNNIKPLKALTPKWQYVDHINKIKRNIIEGEFYEMNYCIEFNAETISFDPLSCFRQLISISPMPFSTLSRFGNVYLISASPERFLKKDGEKIISQPIKGTVRRSFDKTEDDLLKKSLKESEKERAENLMIVDLVRNDLAKSAKSGSVKVDELFGIYTFKKVHQMISTISAEHNPSVKMMDIIKNAFPMGSMTGAPKIRVMEEIDKLEHSTRGLYSGAVGYFSPDGNFDFNVVIRSIVFDNEKKILSFHVGSAITCDSDPEKEYNECLLKAEALLQVLS